MTKTRHQSPGPDARRPRRAFSLLELVIVVVILGVIAAIAVPRLSRGATGAQEAALARNLATLRTAIDLYAAEHNGNFPDDQYIGVQLTQYSNVDGQTSATPGPHVPFGPYLRDIPPVPVGPNAGGNRIWPTDGVDVGWIYDDITGHIRANASGNDSTGKPFADY